MRVGGTVMRVTIVHAVWSGEARVGVTSETGSMVDDTLPRRRDRLLAHAARCGPCGAELANRRHVKERIDQLANPGILDGLLDRLLSVPAEGSSGVPHGLPAQSGKTRIPGPAGSVQG